MKKLFVILYVLTHILVLGACSDVEGEGTPQPLDLRVEAEDYYVQITQENMEGVAFVYRWTNTNAAKYTITLTLITDEEEDDEQYCNIPDKSILTYNDVRELQFTNKDIMNYLNTFGVLAPGTKSSLAITLSAFNADGTPLSAEADGSSKTSTIHVMLDTDIDITNYE